MALVYLSGAWLAGILLGARLSLFLSLSLLSFVPIFLLFFRKHSRIVILLCLCVVIFLAGAWRFQTSQPVENDLGFYQNQDEVEIKGVISSDVEFRDRTLRFVLSAREIEQDNEWHSISGSVLIILPRYPAYQYGDFLYLKGNLEHPTTDSEAELISAEYSQTMAFPEAEPLAEPLNKGKGLRVMEVIYSLRGKMAEVLARVLPEPQASLAQGIVLGIRSSIPEAVNKAFSYSGTMHLLAISGLNLTIVAGILTSLGLWLFGRRHYIYVWLALGMTWFYTMLTGMNPPVMRAAIMVSMFLMAEYLGRQRSALTALAFAGAVMVGIDPPVLWEASFQLSFLAMLGLIFVLPPLRTAGRGIVNRISSQDEWWTSTANMIVDSFATSLAAVIAVQPVVAYYFRTFSPAGVLATLLTLPVLPAIILIGVVAAGLGMLWMPIAHALAWVVWLLLSYLLLVVNVFSGAYFKTGAINATFIILYYSCLILALYLAHHWKKTGNLAARLISRWHELTDKLAAIPLKWVIPSLLVIASLTSIAAATMPDSRLHVIFLDVGQGDAILIKTPAHQEILIDGGPSAQAITQELGNKMPFWDRTIDLVVLTHPDSDHIAGLVAVLERYNVKEVLYPDIAAGTDLYQAWLDTIQEK